MRSLSDAGMQKKQWLASEPVYRIVRLKAEDVPLEIRDEFLRFQGDMTRVKVQDPERSLWATVSAMDETRVSAMVDCVIRMYDTLKRHERQSWARFSACAKQYSNQLTA